MAFQAAGGWTNLPNGNWSPVIYSQKVIKAFRKRSVAEDITNTDYSGEIEKFGDSVEIILEPTIAITSYSRGKQLSSTPINDENITMTIDQANAFQFAVDDIEKKHGHVNFMDLAVNNASYQLKKAFDADILDYIADNVTAANSYGTNDSAGNLTDLGFGTGEVTPLEAMNRLKRLLDEDDVPDEDRWFVADPLFWELMGSEDSKLMNHDFVSKEENLLRNGRINEGLIRGFRCYRSNNFTTGTVGGTQWYVALAGHKSAVATASQLTKVESFRSQNFFGDVTRGLHLYGRKLLRETALAAVFYKID